MTAIRLKPDDYIEAFAFMLNSVEHELRRQRALEEPGWCRVCGDRLPVGEVVCLHHAEERDDPID